MSQSTIRIIATTIAFAVVAVGGIVALNFSGDTAVTTWAYLTLAALGVAFVVYAAIEYFQTRSFNSITSQFDTRTIVLMPIAIALNIILGQTVAAAIKLPIYLDSIGTILVGVLAGPLAGALTGLAVQSALDVAAAAVSQRCCRRVLDRRSRHRPAGRHVLQDRLDAPAADGRHDAAGDRWRRGDLDRRHPGRAGIRRLAGDRQRDLVHSIERQSAVRRSWP